MKGFYNSAGWSLRQELPLVPLCGQCGLYKKCESPKMAVDGKGRRKVLLVAEAPGENEDKRGRPLIGNAGMKMVEILNSIGVHMRVDCWIDNAVICRPHDADGKNRKPLPKEIDSCEPHLLKVIKELKPNVIIPLGAVATRSVVDMSWKRGEVDDMTTWAGWQIPSVKFNAWICPTYHPSFLLHAEGENRPEASVIYMFMVKHLAAAFSYDDRPYEKVPCYDKMLTIEMKDSVAADLIDGFRRDGDPVAFDYETTTLKPDSKHAQILCCSISNGKFSVAFPWHDKAVRAMKELLLDRKVLKIGANIKFEERWTRRHLKIAVRSWFHDTVVGAHWRDCRRGICSVKFQAFVHLGIEDYDSHLAPYIKGKDSNSPNRLKEVEPAVLLRYCAMDALLEYKVMESQLEGW